MTRESGVVGCRVGGREFKGFACVSSAKRGGRRGLSFALRVFVVGVKVEARTKRVAH